MARWLGLALVPAFVGVAHAQAPGETDPDGSFAQPPPSYSPGYTAPGYTQPVVVAADPCGGGCIDPMRNRFSVGVNIGGMGVTVDDDDTQTETNFRTAELAIGYRFTRRFELQLLLSGGRQVLEDGEDGELAMGGGTLLARYRFRPDRKWNWWLGMGLGTTIIERANSTESERENANRAHVAFGIGLERRFNRFAINAEIRGVGMGPRNDSMELEPNTPVPEPGGDPTPRPPRAPVGDTRTGQDLSGGQFTIGALLYF